MPTKPYGLSILRAARRREASLAAAAPVYGGVDKNGHQQQGSSLLLLSFHCLSPVRRKKDSSYHKSGWNEKKKVKTRQSGDTEAGAVERIY